MSRFDKSLFKTGFVSGVTTFNDHYPEDDRNVRMVLSVVVEKGRMIDMIVDTGAPWCLVDPKLFKILGLDFGENNTPETQLMVRGKIYKGNLKRGNITIPAENGENLTIEATFFVPLLSVDEAWRFPNFLGLDGFLNRIRYAVDPAENTFFFGPT